MGCQCGGGRAVTVYQVRRPDGTVKRYLTQVEAERDTAAHGGTWEQITQNTR